MKTQSGQVLLILLLIMTVALAIGLSVVQRSVSDVSTASEIEQSSRAFSAAEGGIESLLNNPSPSLSPTTINYTENNSSAVISVKPQLPLPPASGSQQDALEYQPPNGIGKNEIAQFWLADPAGSGLGIGYNYKELEIYWGQKNPPDSSDFQNLTQPAVEVKVIYLDKTATPPQYKTLLYDIDPNASTHTNGFLLPSDSSFGTGSGCNDNGLPPISTVYSTSKSFYCKVTLNFNNLQLASSSDTSPVLIAVRIRILYSGGTQPVAISAASGDCNASSPPTSSWCWIPAQAELYQSVGQAGESQRTVQLFKMDYIVPFYFDYAVFSNGQISKQGN